jgi:hypothetical protein
LFSSILTLIITIKRIVEEIDKAKEHPTIDRQVPIVLISLPKADLRYFSITLRFVPIKLHLTNENIPSPSFIYCFSLPVI